MGPRCLATLVLLLLLPATASAGTLSREGTTIRYAAAEGERIELGMLGSPSANVALRSLAVVAATGSATTVGVSPCNGGNATIRRCGHRFLNVDATALRFDTLGGDDAIDASGSALPFDGSLPTTFATGAGADRITGGPRNDDLFAGAGDDRLSGGPGPDVIQGEAGDDVVLGLDGNDVVIGGAGTDRLDLSAQGGGGLAVSLDGAADDGPLGSEANISVEDVTGSPAGDILSGGDGRNVIDGGGGNDVIDVRGGGVDAVDCGDGADRVVADAEDAVSRCETVDLGVVVAPGGSPPPVDADGDGVVAGADCDDADAARRPGARDVPGNRVDEDCSGSDAALEVVPARVVFAFAAFRDGTEARALRVRAVPDGGRVQLRCSRRRACGFARERVRVRDDGTAGLLRLVRGRRLPAGLALEVRVSAPEHITKVTRFVMRRGKTPRKRSLCLPPGASAPRRCAR